MEDIADAFHRTPFATPDVNIQPEGDRTLVRLPTYFEVRWSGSGYQPNEVDSLDPRDWFGLHLQVRPLLESVTYDFGDGTKLGPTAALGGPYPSGDVVHEYPEAGTVDVRVSARVRGQVAINGSEWIDIPGDAGITGPPVALTVLTATNRLYENPGD